MCPLLCTPWAHVAAEPVALFVRVMIPDAYAAPAVQLSAQS